LACYIPRWNTCPDTVTHPSTNRARRALTSFTRGTPLTTALRRQPGCHACSVYTLLKPNQPGCRCLPRVRIDAVVHDCRPTASCAPRRQISSLNSTQLTLNTRVCRLMTMLRPGKGAECCDECVCLSVRLFPLEPTDLDLDFLHVAFDYRILYATIRDAGLACARKFDIGSQLNLAHGTMCAWVVSCERKLAEVNCRLVHVRYRSGRTDRQTHSSQYSARLPGRSIVIKRQTRVLSVS